MGYRLYGHELDEDHSALEAGLGWAVKLTKPMFIGRDALLKEKAAGSRQRLIGFRLKDRGVPREKCEIHFGGKPVGTVTSGTFSPSLGIGIGMAYVDNALMPKATETASPLTVQIHGRAVPAEVTPLPFYRKTTPREV
jgi:aminomethyltransferase